MSRQAQVALAAVAAAILLAAVLAWLQEVSWASPGPGGGEYSQPQGPYLAPSDLSEVIEEARRITREAAGDNPG